MAHNKLQSGSKAVHRYMDDTCRDKAFYHMIIIQGATVLALCIDLHLHSLRLYAQLNGPIRKLSEQTAQLPIIFISL